MDIPKTTFWIFTGCVLLYLVKKCYQRWRMLKMGSKFKGPKETSFILGHFEILKNQKDLYKNFRSFAKEYHPHYYLRIFTGLSVNILEPEDCGIFMSTKKHTTKGMIYKRLVNWLKDGLLLSTGEKWAKRRKILTSTFHFSILKDFINTFNEETEKLVDIIARKCGEAIDICPIVSEFALHSINETAMGHNLDPNNMDQKEYRDAIYKIEGIIQYSMLRPWLYIDWIYFFSWAYEEEQRLLKILHKFTRNVISTRMKIFEGISGLIAQDEYTDDIYMSKKKKRVAMLDVLLEANKDGEQIDYKGISEEVDTFMFEGHDTTASAIGFILMLLANHLEIQEKVLQEVKSVLGEKITKPTYIDLQKMDLLERCIKESLRLYPSVYLISRICEEDTVLHSGLIVPKDAEVQIHIFDIHRNPAIFPDPEKFDPDRFLPENCVNRHPFAYIPFSAGPRNCIGQKFAMLEIKAVLVGILQCFKLTAVDTPDSIELRTELILRSRNGIKIKFNKRI